MLLFSPADDGAKSRISSEHPVYVICPDRIGCSHASAGLQKADAMAEVIQELDTAQIVCCQTAISQNGGWSPCSALEVAQAPSSCQ